MAYSALTAAETDADSPLNQNITDKIRLNFDAIYGYTSPVLFSIQLWKYNNDPAGGSVTSYAIPFEGVALAQYHMIRDVSNAATETFFEAFYVYIPANVSTVRIYYKATGEIDAPATISITFYLGAASGTTTGITTSATAYTCDIDVSGIAGSVVEFKGASTNNSGAQRWVQLNQYVIGVAAG